MSTFRKAGPSARAARSTLTLRSCQCDAAACAAYGTWWATAIAVMSLRCCALPKLAVAARARRRRGAERRRAGALDARVHVGLVVVADEEEAVAALERARERLQADVVRAAVAGEDDDRDLLVLAGSACRRRSARWALSTPLATAAAFSNATCSQGTFQAVAGKRVVATSRQPVAFTTTTGCVNVSSTVRTTSGTPQPWQSAWPSGERRHAGLVADECLQAGHGSPRSPT